MIYSLIPAKVNSSRLPGKNTTSFMLGDRPLMSYTIEAVIEAGYIPSLFTDEEADFIHDIPIIKRPPETCRPESTMKEIVEEFIRIKKIKQDDVILLTYLTCPFRTAEDIKNAIDKFSRYNANSLQSLNRVNYRPYGLMKAIDKEEGKEYKHFTCLQDQKDYYQQQNTPTLYKANGAIYIFKVSELDKLNNQMFNNDTIGFVLDEIHGLDIDTELDLWLAEAILKRRHNEGFITELSNKRNFKSECDSDGVSSNIQYFEESRT